MSGSVQFSKGSRRERDLSPDVTLVPSSIILFLPHPGPSVSDCVCLFPCFCQSDLTLWKCLCATVGIARTSLRGQSPHEWKEKESSPVLILFVFVPDCLHVSAQQFQTSSSTLLFGCGSTKAQINRSFPSQGGGVRP